METKQTIAIIGATGNMGSAIAKSLAKGPYRLLLIANDGQKLQSMQADISTDSPSAEAETVSSLQDANGTADIFILAVPYAAEAEIASQIREAATGKIVISISNPINGSMTALVTAPDTSAAEELQKLLPEAKVIKAFNTTFAADFTQPVIDDKQVDAFIAGNDEAAMQTVAALTETAGFNPIMAGDLPVSNTLEHMQLLLMQLGLKYNYNWMAGWKILHQ